MEQEQFQISGRNSRNETSSTFGLPVEESLFGLANISDEDIVDDSSCWFLALIDIQLDVNDRIWCHQS